MNGNAELLNFIYQNSQMGVDTIGQLLTITENENFKNHIETQHEGYKSFHQRSKNMLNANGYDEKGISGYDKLKTYIMINFQTLNDKSASHISEMLIIGSNMGVINAIKNIRKYKNTEPDIIKMMEDLQKFEEANIEKLKAFL